MPQLILHGEFTLSGVIAKIVHAVENVHTFETSKDWDEENKMKDEKEVINTMHKEEKNFKHNKENTEEENSLEEKILANEMMEEDNFSKEKEVNYFKEKQENFPKQEKNKTKV